MLNINNIAPSFQDNNVGPTTIKLRMNHMYINNNVGPTTIKLRMNHKYINIYIM